MDTRTPTAPRLGWQPIEGMFATPVLFEGEELPGGAPAPAADATPPPPAPAAPPAPAEGAPPAAPEPAPWEGKSAEDLWKDNEKLRNESIQRKERFRPWEEATQGLHDDDVTFYRDFLGAVASGDQTKLAELAPFMREALDKLTPAQQQQLAGAVEQAAEDFDPYDAKQLDARIEAKATEMLTARERAADTQRQQQKALDDLHSHLKTLESDPDVEIADLGDPTSIAYSVVLSMAQNNPEIKAIGDPMERVTAAAKAYRADLDRRAQALLKAKAPADAAAAPVLPQGGHEPGGREAPKDLRAAKASALERVEKILAGSQNAVGT